MELSEQFQANIGASSIPSVSVPAVPAFFANSVRAKGVLLCSSFRMVRSF
jgi:hypothetical protein